MSSQEGERSCICMLRVPNLLLPTIFLWDLGTVPTLWHYLFFYWTLELFRECGIIGFSMGLWNCSDSVALFVFLLNFGDVPTLWHYLFLYWNLELFRQRGIICFSIGLWNCSDSVALLVFLLDFGNFPTECIVCFSMGLWTLELFVFPFYFRTVP